MKRFLLSLPLLALLFPAWYLADLPDVGRLRKENPTTSAIRAYRERQAKDAGKKPHSTMIWRNLSDISPYLRHAVVISEDDMFFQHHGFDLAALRRAMEINWERKRFAFGASTLTQQLARSLFLSPNKNILRKLKEALITRRLEQMLSKKRILELYLNVAEWGPGLYGAEAASRHFFQKPAADLTPEEAIALAAILPSPRRWNPVGESRFMTQRKAILYDRMVRAHYLPPKVSSEPVIGPMLDGETPVIQADEPALEPDADEPAEPDQP